MKIGAAADTHLYVIEYDHPAPNTSITLSLYSVEISTGTGRQLGKDTTILD